MWNDDYKLINNFPLIFFSYGFHLSLDYVWCIQNKKYSYHKNSGSARWPCIEFYASSYYFAAPRWHCQCLCHPSLQVLYPWWIDSRCAVKISYFHKHNYITWEYLYIYSHLFLVLFVFIGFELKKEHIMHGIYS